MKHLVIAAALLAATSITAHAGPKPTFPKEFRGIWCPIPNPNHDDGDAHQYFKRVAPGGCDNDGGMAVDATGITNGEEVRQRCTLQYAMPTRHGTLHATYKCRMKGEPDSIRDEWIGKSGPNLLFTEEIK